MVNDWQKTRLRQVTQKIERGKVPSGYTGGIASTRVMLLRSRNVHFEGVNLDHVDFVDDAFDQNSVATRVKPGDILLCTTGSSIGRCTVVPKTLPAASISTDLCVIRADITRIAPDYLNFVLQSHAFQVAIRTRMRFSVEWVGAFEVTLPPLSNQETLVSGIASKLELMQSVMKKKERLLALVDERRRTLVVDAAANGLDRTVPRRSPGVVSLGDVPAHWQIARAKWLLIERDESPDSDAYPLLTVSRGKVIVSRMDATYKASGTRTKGPKGHMRCDTGDLIVNTMGTSIDAVGIARQRGIVGPGYKVYQPATALDPDYLDFVVRALEFASSTTSGSGTVRSRDERVYYPDRLMEAWLPLPPLDEQQYIAAHVKREIRVVDDLSGMIRHTIDLLQEGRAALISAVAQEPPGVAGDFA